MQTSHSILAFFAILAGFLLLLSKVSFLLVPGLLLIVGGMFAPFYEDQLREVFHQVFRRERPQTSENTQQEDENAHDLKTDSAELTTKLRQRAMNAVAQGHELYGRTKEELTAAYKEAGQYRPKATTQEESKKDTELEDNLKQLEDAIKKVENSSPKQ